ncbi:unnamed protein product [Protopolystoma xenopodis]|uniref:Uncharacterized protein n=1 Tax=Protopolystoma xenopodis TaxID=117903 RepID=A0A3S5AYG4_9PLAT|nr:unnamed protein product [Protopolystoma xenopodis]
MHDRKPCWPTEHANLHKPAQTSTDPHIYTRKEVVESSDMLTTAGTGLGNALVRRRCRSRGLSLWLDHAKSNRRSFDLLQHSASKHLLAGSGLEDNHHPVALSRLEGSWSESSRRVEVFIR